MLSVQMKQRVNLKFLVKLGKTFTEAYAMLKEVYGKEFLSRTQVFEWFKQFKEGRETTEDDPRPGRPSKSETDENIEKNGASTFFIAPGLDTPASGPASTVKSSLFTNE
ncbi:hypothetical protein NQ318_012255 [Aromia moschata]|uniref:Mos1 transposase HTH domain-containing protein n=1 Tax=Aromia moschata TaxID=1265417 RepID=A0AAV8X418_9CUCU|nr:hypothetical protein NQ318_012255 [Aromia moschata]